MGFIKDPFAKQVVEDSVKIFCSAENIDYELQINLFSFLIAAIKFHFSNDVKKIKELITMALSSLEIDSFDKLSSFEKKDYMINLISNNNKELREEISSQKEELSLKDEELSFKDKELSEKDEIISSQSETISKLKEIMNKNGINIGYLN